MQYSKTCVLCDEKIRAHHKLCTQHFIEYRDQMNAPWFVELLELQKQQDKIDRMERFLLPYYSETNIYGQQKPAELLAKRSVGRPATDWRLIDKVLKIYDESVEETRQGIRDRPKPLRAIARELGNKLGYVTVRNILMKYRPVDYTGELYEKKARMS